jgi:hypothetical protein
VQFRARKDYLIAEFRVQCSDDVAALIDGSGVDNLPYDKRWGRYRLRLTGSEIEDHRKLLVDLIGRASGTPPPVDE